MKKPRAPRLPDPKDDEAEIGWPSVAALVADKQRSVKKARARFASRERAQPLQKTEARLDKNCCQSFAGLRLSSIALAALNELAKYCELYADLASEGRRAPLFMMEDFRPLHRRQRADILTALVEGVTEVWRDSGGTKRERLTQLVVSLFNQTGAKLPPASTLRRAVRAAYNRRGYS